MLAKRAIVLLSGGLDSSTLLYQLQFEDYDVIGLAVDYGQRHAREIASALAVAEVARVPLMNLQLAAALAPVFAQAKSSQVGRNKAEVPHGHYASDAMKTTIVPNRNMLLLALAGALAESVGAGVVAYGAHAGDHPIYPDCRPEFYESCDETLKFATAERVALYAPFGRITKSDIVRRATQLRVPLGLTWSCYEDRDLHCGACGTCVERIEAFRDANVPDPTKYASAASV